MMLKMLTVNTVMMMLPLMMMSMIIRMMMTLLIMIMPVKAYNSEYNDDYGILLQG